MKGNVWKKTIFLLCVVGVLVFSFWYGGTAPGLQGFSITGESDNDNVVAVNSLEEDSYVVNDRDKVNKEEVDADSENGKQTNEDKVADKEQSESDADVQDADEHSDSDAEQGETGGQEDSSTEGKETDGQSNPDEETKKTDKQKDSATEEKKNDKQSDTDKNQNTTEKKKDSKEKTDAIDQNTKDIATKDTGSDEGKDTVKEPGNEKSTINCTIYISCATVLDNMDYLDASKQGIIPDNGVILGETTVQIEAGSTVFDVLQKVTKEKKIHLEYAFTPMYESYYIEGIHNLYEFDCGNTSGWEYSVNGAFPSDGCSFYEVKDGDKIRWLYSCNLGADIGK